LYGLGAGFYSFNLTHKKQLYLRAREALGAFIATAKFYELGEKNLIKEIEENLISALSALIKKLENKIEKN